MTEEEKKALRMLGFTVTEYPDEGKIIVEKQLSESEIYRIVMTKKQPVSVIFINMIAKGWNQGYREGNDSAKMAMRKALGL